jgi:hypothetical protein
MSYSSCISSSTASIAKNNMREQKLQEFCGAKKENIRFKKDESTIVNLNRLFIGTFRMKKGT